MASRTASRARIYRGTPRNLARLARALQRGELVAVPTETVYGLAANALDAAACRQIFRAKRRPATDPLIVHVGSLAELDRIAEASPAARRLARAFWPGPLTLVLPKRPIVPDAVTAGLPSVAVRISAHPLLHRLLVRSGLALAAPSANPFGYISPTTAAHVRESLGRKISAILDGGPCAIGLESTIVDLRDPARPRLLRPGAVTRPAIEKVLGRRLAVHRGSGSASRAQAAPGQLARHYSPRTPTILHRRLTLAQAQSGKAGEAWVFFRRPVGKPGSNVFWLDAAGDPRRAARNLFRLLRRLDAGGWRRIHLEEAPGQGLAEAINDRLRRAANA